MIISILVADQIVVIDGVVQNVTANVVYPANTHAIFWDGTSGIKQMIGDVSHYEEAFTSISEIQQFIDEHTAMTNYVPTAYWDAEGLEWSLGYGETLPPGAVTTKNLAAYKLDLDATYAEKAALNVTVDTRGIKNSASDYSDMTAHSMSNAANVMLQLTDGTFHTYTNADFTAMWNKVNEYRQLCVSNKSTLTTSLNDAADPSTIDLTAGWPATTMTTS